MPGESIDGSNLRNWLFSFTEKRNSSETKKLRGFSGILPFIGPWGGGYIMMSDIPNGDVMMEAHTRRMGLVDSIKVLTQLVESHAPLT